jgi:dTDP-4-dehydrorhamnose reductase
VDKLLVTRSETLVGANLAPVLGNRLDVIGLDMGASTSAACDAIHHERPQLVVHSGPLSVSAWDAAGLGATRLLNRADVNREAEYLTYVVAACREVGAKLVVAASDAIFDGPRMFHDENSLPSARRAFGKAAVQVEAALRGSGALLLRSHVYGWCPAGYGANYAERMFEELTGELPCSVDAVRHATPILATDFAELIYAAYRVDLTGLYHAAGAERTSPY